ncbi:MAG TPA: ABC transporter permease [Actinophytocola sp.]|uniref:ABC transporter permease n=1 Tax=Actinophytocola sp. TaxID=1872138 RepID=UPI002DB63B6C|nr:ABC transporter permease [Actinophytocola sp.]HEU5470454.1 ABC transporter permease [Actinophytocola sp.]
MALPTADIAAIAPEPPSAVVPPVRRRRLRFIANRKAGIGLVILGCFGLLAAIGPMIAPYDPSARGPDLVAPPSAAHWLGTTHLGQDILSQMLVGARSVLFVGLVAGLVATVLAVVIGVTSGYLPGVAGELLSVLSNVVLVIPVLLLVIMIATIIEDADDLTIALVLGATTWPWSARVLRAQTMSLRRRDFTEAARAVGEPTWRIIGFELLPNLTAVIAARFVDTVIFAVLSEIALAFIGISGVSEWNWGTILFWAQSQQALAQGAWWWFVPAGLAIALLGTGLALLNFGIDEFVNPRLRNVSTGKVGLTPVIPEVKA